MLSKIRHISIRAVLAVMLVSLFLMPITSQADELTNRSITLLDSAPSASTDHLFSFNFLSSSSVGSVVFEYCDSSAVFGTPCIPPPGLNVQAASLDFQFGETSFTKHPSTSSNRFVITRGSTAVTPGLAQYLISGAVNQSAVNDTVYIRISSHASSDGSGPMIDSGAVAFSTAPRITASAFVPPYLLFCVGVSVSLDCTSVTGNFIDLGELSVNQPALATSQYSGATNDPSGYGVTVYGTTLTSGNNIIPALNTPSAAQTGVSQFGINLRDNNSPDVGIEPIGPGTSSIKADYNTPNQFKYTSGQITSEVNMTSSYDRMTVSYMVNISNDQPAGVYSSTFTYIATASF